jgi:hypothetical protein
MRSHVIRWLAIPALVAGMALAIPAFASAAFAQAAPPAPSTDQVPPGTPSVGVTPIGMDPKGPNGGQWFVLNLSPGEAGQSEARIANPADIPQTVKLFFADLDFAADGTPSIAKTNSDVATWGKAAVDQLTIPPKSASTVPFTITVPTGADPGDHVGVLIAQGPRVNSPGQAYGTVTQVATRLYVTVPGDARADFAIQKLTTKKDSAFFTKEITTTVVLHNTGRIRLHPTVKINGRVASGPATLLTRSVESYFVTQKVPVWGGPIASNVQVSTMVDRVGQQEPGPSRTASASTFVIPYVLFIGLALLVGFFFLVRWLWRRRGGKYAAIQADLRRFERLVQQQRAAGEDTADVAGEAELAIKAAIKQAGRAGDKDTEIKLRGKLAELREQEAAPPPPPSAPSPAPTSPAPAAAGSSPQPASVAAPAPEPTNGNGSPVQPDNPVRTENGHSAVVNGNGNGQGNGHGHEREDDASLVAILRVLATAPPGGQRFALVKAARNHGREAIEAHAEELAALPEDVRIRLLRTASQQPEPSEIA